MSRENVQSIYPLLPQQEAFLVAREHASQDPGLIQGLYTIDGPLEPDRFEGAVDAMLARHEMLRASVKIRDGKSPLLVVWKRVPISITWTALQQLNPREQEAEIERLRNEDLTASANLIESEAFHLRVIQLAAQRNALLWTFHHLFLDGWSTLIAIRDLIAEYDRIDGPPTTPTVPNSFGQFLAWHKAQDKSASERFWRQQFQGYQGILPRFVSPKKTEPEIAEPAPKITLARSFDAADSAALNHLIRRRQLTQNSLVAGVWALALHKIYEQNDVTFGATVTGRAIPQNFIQNLVGLVSNLIPFRVQLDPEIDLWHWLRTLRDRQFETQTFEHTPFADIEKLCTIQRRHVLLETMVVVESFPSGEHAPTTLALDHFQSGISTPFPLTLCVLPGQGWTLKCVYCPDHVDADFAEAVLNFVDQGMRSIIQTDSSDEDTTVGELGNRLPLLQRDPCIQNEPNVSRPHENAELVAGALGAPENATELRMIEIWESVLGMAEIRVDDDFFEIGGRSLTAVRLLSAIEDTFGTRYSPAILVEHPTVRQLAGLVGNDQSNLRSSTLIRLNMRRQENEEEKAERQTKAPLICVHAGGEQAMYFRFLAKYFQDRPVMALQSRGLEGEVPLRSIEAIATDYLKSLQSEFGDQSLHLVGYCAGSPVAFEMVHQCESLRRSIGSLTIVDSGLRMPGEITLPYYLQHYGTVRRALPRFAYMWSRSKLRTCQHWADRLYCTVAGTTERRRKMFQERVTRATMAGYYAYQAASVQQDINLIRSSESESTANKNFHLQWQQHTSGNFSKHVVPGQHLSILLEPTVQLVAQQLEEIIQAAEVD